MSSCLIDVILNAATTPPPLCVGPEEAKVPLSDSSGVYLKTACFEFNTVIQSDANAYCTSNRMRLFVIDSAATQNSLFAFLKPQMSGFAVAFRVDGIRDTTDSNWYYFSYGKAPAFAGLSWLQTSATPTGMDNLVVTNTIYPQLTVTQDFYCDGIDVPSLLPFICEFK